MSVHRSLKTRNALERHRNVLTRDERIKVMRDQERWEEGRSVFGLPKIAHRKAAVGGKGKKEAAEGAEAAAPGAAPAAGAAAAPAKGAAAAKGAPAKDAKAKK